MASISVEIKGMPKLRRKILAVLPALKAGIKAATVHVEGKINTYPPETIANKAKTFTSGGNNRWYERGWGTKWALSAGSWHGYKTSQDLKARWTIAFKNAGLTGVVGNNADYAPYVQGPLQGSPPLQATALKKIGWKSVTTVAEEESETVAKFIQGHVEKALNK